ncbi:drebrin-like protein B [Anabrus simplex]|uniref:drebrin-like protein B n=1 Tax=Anabrus simplex TaxID=316456 RepID=UPI0035A35ABB
MAINLSKYKESLLAAWKDVLDDKTDTDWALFGYEGQTNDLKVVSKGAGGVEEMIEDLNSGKIMYAFCKILDPKTSLPKCVLINWQGEGAPLVRKGTCANHVRDVGNFFKGAHVTMNARNEEEVDPQLITEKVAKSTGSAYSFKERGDHAEESGPIGTTYKRVIPTQEINSRERDKFWEKEEQEEKKRQEEERKRKEEERLRLENERKQRELSEAALREEKIRERNQNISKLREAEKNADDHTREKENVNINEVAERELEEEERKGRSDVLRRQRSQEAQAVISQRTFNARAVFEQNTSAGQMHSLRRASLNPHPMSAPVEVQSPATVGRKASLPTWPPAGSNMAQVTEQHNEACSQERSPSPSPVPYSVSSHPVETNSNIELVSSAPAENEQIVSLTERVPSPQQQQWESNGVQPDLLQNQIPLEQEEDDEALVYDQMHLGSDLGLKARALYDYQAADPTEITFDPGDIITHIDQIDEGWWQGLGPDGTFGLFPANYVELIN